MRIKPLRIVLRIASACPEVTIPRPRCAQFLRFLCFLALSCAVHAFQLPPAHRGLVSQRAKVLSSSNADGAPGAHGGGGGAPGNGGGGAHAGGASGGGAAFPTLLRLGDLRRPGVRPGVPLRDRAGSSSALGVFFAGVHDRRGRFLMATSSSSSSSWLDRGLFSAAGDRVGRRFRMWTTSSLSMVERGEATTALKSRARREGV